MIVATLIMIIGLAVVAALSHWKGYRCGGVMGIPLLAIYTFREPVSPLIFFTGVVGVWGVLWLTREHTLYHGRRVFLIGVGTSVFITTIVAYSVVAYSSIDFSLAEIEVVASIFPGVAAYNLMRIPPENRLKDIIIQLLTFSGLIAVGAGGVLFFQGQAYPTAPVFSLPTGGLFVWLRIDPQGTAVTRVVPHWLSTGLLAIDVIIYELIRNRYEITLAGIVVIPLLAIFSVQFEYIPVIFAIGATIAYSIISVTHWLTLLYGRVLLGVSIIFGISYTFALSWLTFIHIPGITLLFIGLFVGVASHNLHQTSPKTRTASVCISAGLFVTFYMILLVFIEIPPSGLFTANYGAYLIVGVATLVLAFGQIYQLECSRPSVAEFAYASVFEDADPNDPGTVDSPLVSNSNEPSHDAESQRSRDDKL